MGTEHGTVTTRTISRALREHIRAEHPGVDKDAAYWRFVELLIFAPRDERGRIVISQAVLARVEGKTQQLRNHDYNGLAFLDEVTRDVLPGLAGKGHDPFKHQARAVTHTGFSEELQAAIAAELATPITELRDRCDVVSGKPYTDKLRRAARLVQQAAAQAETQAWTGKPVAAGCAVVQALADYLNTQGSERFYGLLKTPITAAYAEAAAITSPPRRERAFQVLRAICDQPQQFYVPSDTGRTVRLFTYNVGIADLPREVRKALLAPHVTLDLASAQLAIVARLWDVPSVGAWLLDHRHSGRKVWASLCDALGIAYTADHKQACKDMVYALCFGSGTRSNGKMTINARAYFGDAAPALVKQFVAIPVMADLLQARKRAAAQVQADGGGRDCFGNWIALGPTEPGRSATASVLACQAQAVELKLLLPVVERARARGDIAILCWLFDGCTLAVRDKQRRAAVVKRLQADVARVADELGIVTALGVDE